MDANASLTLIRLKMHFNGRRHTTLYTPVKD